MPSKKSVTRWTGATRLPERERKRGRERERNRECERERERENGRDDVNSITRKGDERNERRGHKWKRRELLKKEESCLRHPLSGGNQQ